MTGIVADLYGQIPCLLKRHLLREELIESCDDVGVVGMRVSKGLGLDLVGAHAALVHLGREIARNARCKIVKLARIAMDFGDGSEQGSVTLDVLVDLDQLEIAQLRNRLACPAIFEELTEDGLDAMAARELHAGEAAQSGPLYSLVARLSLRTLRRSTPAVCATPSLMSALRRFQTRGEGGSLLGAEVLPNPSARKCELMRGMYPPPVCPQVDAALKS